ncbi:hypothetical protein GGI07_005559 [Coemansia sp. Benny D115]|nr:hypothetical protein GGI07_005559 [Coemansia sp. Benny D115]
MNSSSNDCNELPHKASEIFDVPRDTLQSFGRLVPQYRPKMHYPNEVDLYEPTVATPDTSKVFRKPNTPTVRSHVDVDLPCGHFNVWRPLHNQTTAQISTRLLHFFPEAPATREKNSSGDMPPFDSSVPWHSRVSYSSADDEYFQNALALPYIKGWDSGCVHQQNVFRKVEHDWNMTYLAPSSHEAQRSTPSLIVWRFNYQESHGVVCAFSAALGFALYSKTASVQWYVRPLSKRQFVSIPMHLLTPEEVVYFPEVPQSDLSDDPNALEIRQRIVDKYKGHILAYKAPSDIYNKFIVFSVPGLVDLSQYVAGEYGFEIAVQMFPADKGKDRWQKVQVARQSLLQTVSGRTRDSEAMLTCCGLDFRVKLRPDIVVDPVSEKLSNVLNPPGSSPSDVLRMDGPGSDFTICIIDPENTAGCLQPPIQAHERVLAEGSEYFAALFASSMAESKSRTVTLNSMPYGFVRCAINFIYTGKVANAQGFQLEDWILLLDVSSRLSIMRLNQVCQREIFTEALNDLYAGSDTPNETVGSKSIQSMDKSEEKQPEPREFVSPQDYEGTWDFPALELFEYLKGVADDNGAQELGEALDRTIDYYSIAQQESAMRTGKNKDTFLQSPARPDHGYRVHDPFLHIQHRHRPFPTHNVAGIEHMFMPGHLIPMDGIEASDSDDVSDEDDEDDENENHSYDEQNENEQDIAHGIGQRFMRAIGGARQMFIPLAMGPPQPNAEQNAQRNTNTRDTTPPSPQPGPVPAAPSRTDDFSDETSNHSE